MKGTKLVAGTSANQKTLFSIAGKKNEDAAIIIGIAINRRTDCIETFNQGVGLFST